MLDFMRKFAQSLVMKAFLVLLVLSFAAWGIGDVFRVRGSSNAVATVGSGEIGLDAFNAEFSREVARMGRSMGVPITREQAIQFGLHAMVLERMISTKLIQESASEQGLMVSDTIIAQAIKDSPDFQDKDGKFDRGIYNELLSRAGLTEDMYVAQVRDGIIRQQYLSPIATGLRTPKVLVDTLYKVASEMRLLDVVRIDHARIKDVPAPTDADLEQFHKDQASLFMAPELRSWTALVVTLDDVAKTVTVTQDELKAAYDERAEDFTTPETRELRQVLVKDEAQAQQAASLLAQGQSLDDVIKAVGANPAMSKLGTFSRAEAETMSKDLAEAVFSTAQGAFTQPVKSPLGWHVIEVAKIAPGHAQSLDEASAELKKTLINDRAVEALYKMSTDLEDMLGGGQTIEEAAKALGLSVQTLKDVGAQGQTADGLPAEGLMSAGAYAPDMLAKAFEIGEGQDSGVVETQDAKAYFVVRLDGVTSPAVRPLDTVKTQVAQAWLEQLQADKAQEIAKAVAERLKTGEKAADVAKALGFDAFATEPFTRSGQGLKLGALPANVIEQAFAQPQGGIATGEGTGAHTVAVVTGILDASVDENTQRYQDMHDRVLRDMQGDLLSQLVGVLQDRLAVTVNQSALQDFTN